jgi:flagellar protein FlbT
MNISLRRGERIFINGAVIRVDRKVCIELLNDVTFLLEHHIIQSEEARSPLERLYLAIQTILISPADSHKSLIISLELIKNFLHLTEDGLLVDQLITIQNFLENEKPFDALKSLRGVIHLDSENAIHRDHQGRLSTAQDELI